MPESSFCKCFQGLRKRRKPGSKDWVRKDSSGWPHGFVETRVLTASHFCLNALLVLTGFPTSVYVEFGLSGLPQLLEGLSTVVKKRQAEARMHRSFYMNVKDVAVLVLEVYAACLFVQKGTIRTNYIISHVRKPNLQLAWPGSHRFLMAGLTRATDSAALSGPRGGVCRATEISPLRVSKKSNFALEISCMFLHHVACSDGFLPYLSHFAICVMSCE